MNLRLKRVTMVMMKAENWITYRILLTSNYIIRNNVNILYEYTMYVYIIAYQTMKRK